MSSIAERVKKARTLTGGFSKCGPLTTKREFSEVVDIKSMNGEGCGEDSFKEFHWEQQRNRAATNMKHRSKEVL